MDIHHMLYYIITCFITSSPHMVIHHMLYYIITFMITHVDAITEMTELNVRRATERAVMLIR